MLEYNSTRLIRLIWAEIEFKHDLSYDVLFLLLDGTSISVRPVTEKNISRQIEIQLNNVVYSLFANQQQHIKSTINLNCTICLHQVVLLNSNCYCCLSIAVTRSNRQYNRQLLTLLLCMHKRLLCRRFITSFKLNWSLKNIRQLP